ncbi:MAG: phosphoadenylyl-sulfate reductase [Pseudomonadales bacterium]|nr:phosphoadenylyl-sulfate reductase [Pseudomonadales bacterium]
MPERHTPTAAFTDAAHLENWNKRMAGLDAAGRIACALEHLPGRHVLTSSFGAQAAVSLHLLTVAMPDIPVILLDTGYLFKETYQFIDDLTRRLSLNLQVYRSRRSPAWQEAADGQRWTKGVEGIDAYNAENKVEPMRRAMRDQQVGTWFSGLRRSQSESRRDTPYVQYTGGQFKVCPIADWSDKDVFNYLMEHSLPYHPLWHEGYVSIGDTHTTLSLLDAENEESTRFFGLKRECGLHEADFSEPADVSARS